MAAPKRATIRRRIGAECFSQRDANWDVVTLRQNGTKRALSQTIPYGQDQIREDGWSSRARGSSRRITVLTLIDLMQQSIPFFVTTLLAK
jgi:hypothetical protein